MSPIRLTDPPAAQRRHRPRASAASSNGADRHAVPRNTHKGALKPMRLTWRDGSAVGSMGAPIPRPLAKGPQESRRQAAEAATHLKQFDEIMRERWNRAGWNDSGGDLTVMVNQRAMGGNAYFASFPDGTGEMGIGVRDARIGFRKSPAWSPSILFHEYVHGIVGSELRDMPKKLQSVLSHREHNAVNESIADVISTGLLDTNWRNGHEIRKGVPLRDLADPPVPKWTKAVRTDGGIKEHTISGVLSRAAVLAAESAGTLPVVDAWYAGIDGHYRTELLAARRPGGGRALGAWVRATMRGAEQVGGAGSALVEAVRGGWEEVGLGRYASKEQLRRT